MAMRIKYPWSSSFEKSKCRSYVDFTIYLFVHFLRSGANEVAYVIFDIAGDM